MSTAPLARIRGSHLAEATQGERGVAKGSATPGRTPAGRGGHTECKHMKRSELHASVP